MDMKTAISRATARSGGPTRPTNVTLSSALVDEAKALGVNISQAATSGLEQAVAWKRSERWLEENGEALDSFNEYIEQNGLPLERFRLF